jgi:hypothetical protein
MCDITWFSCLTLGKRGKWYETPPKAGQTRTGNPFAAEPAGTAGRRGGERVPAVKNGSEANQKRLEPFPGSGEAHLLGIANGSDLGPVRKCEQVNA